MIEYVARIAIYQVQHVQDPSVSNNEKERMAKELKRWYEDAKWRTTGPGPW